MFRRLFVIPLRPDADPALVRELVQVLEAAPQYVPSMRWSTVAAERSPSPYHLVWDHAFEDEAGFREYIVNPYHCNIIDHYMYRESPVCVVGNDPICLRWDDDGHRGLDQWTGSSMPRDQDDPAVGSHVPVDTALAAPDAAEQPIYLVEQFDLLPGKAEDYLKLVAREYQPVATKRGMRLVLSLRTPTGTGEESLLFVWAIAGWVSWSHVRSAFHYDEAGLTKWLETVRPLRAGGRRRLLIGTELAGAGLLAPFTAYDGISAPNS
jgi:hypothetical protein